MAFKGVQLQQIQQELQLVWNHYFSTVGQSNKATAVANGWQALLSPAAINGAYLRASTQLRAGNWLLYQLQAGAKHGFSKASLPAIT